jgi:hypothetical protein
MKVEVTGVLREGQVIGLEVTPTRANLHVDPT